MPGGYFASLWMVLMDDLVGGELSNQAIIGFKQKPAPPEVVAGKLPGRYHFTLHPGDSDVIPVYEPPPKTPKGSGFAAMLVYPDGKVTWSGKLPEGTALTGSSGLGRNADTNSWLVPMHQLPHGRWSSVQGFFGFQDGNPIASALLDWTKYIVPANSRVRLYPWIPLISLEGEGSRHLTGKDVPLLDNAFDLTGSAANADLTLSMGGLTEDLTAPLRVEKSGRITATVQAPLSAPRLSWAPATGLFATTATISTPDAARPGKSISRSLTGQSLWIPHLRKTVGQFTLPQLADPAASPPTTATSSPSLRPGHYRPGRGCALILRFAASPAGAGSGLRGVEGFNRFSSVRSSMRNCR